MPIVKYDNKLNLIPFQNISKFENDVFFALLYKLKNQGSKEIQLDFIELKELLNFNRDSDSIRRSVKDIAKKIASCVVEYETEETTKFFALFQILEVPNKGKYYIRAKISEPFEYVLNNLNFNFTAFELAEFSSLSSKYTQALYRILKQFKRSGFLKLEWEKFRKVLNIPKSYQICDINKQIIKPTIKELSSGDSPIFPNLHYRKIRGRGRGRPLTHIEFSFTPEVYNPNDKKVQKIAIQNAETKKRPRNALELISHSNIGKHTTEVEKIDLNPLGGSQMSYCESFIGHQFSTFSKFGHWESCKITLLEEIAGGVKMTAKNQENQTEFSLTFGSKNHFENWLKKQAN